MNLPSLEKLPAEISKAAKPTQLRGSADPWESQVFEDSVITTRRKRARTGWLATRRRGAPPLLWEISPCGNVAHAPASGRSMGFSPPAQYWTRNLVAYGSAQLIRIASTRCGAPKSTTIHCGRSESASRGNFVAREGLFFQYVRASPSAGCESPCGDPPLRVMDRS